MNSFEQFLEYIRWLFSFEKVSVEENKWIINDLFSRMLNFDGMVIIDLINLKEVYDRVVARQCQELEFYSENYYEVPVESRYHYFYEPEKMRLEDRINGIEYNCNNASLDFYVHFLVRLEAMQGKSKKRISISPTAYRALTTQMQENSGILDFHGLISSVYPITTIKITTQSKFFLETMRDLRNSYQFNIMYSKSLVLREYTDLHAIIKSGKTSYMPASSLLDAPRRTYVSEALEYYKRAMASIDNYTKFISFYHVIEYFFDEVFKRRLVTEIRKKLTNPSFSYKSDDRIYEIAKFVRKEIKNVEDVGQGNEFDSLLYVICEYVKMEDVETRLKDYVGDYASYYSQNKVCFCNAPTIDWSNEAKFEKTLAKRIYTTRNSLVHSKSSHENERYKHFKDESALRKELPLLQTIAELVIIHSGKEL